MKRLFKFMPLIAMACLLVAVAFPAYGGTITQHKYGAAVPFLKQMTEGDTGSQSAYKLNLPTLSADDTVCGIATTQDISGKTFTDTGFITEDNLVDRWEQVSFQITDAFIDGSGPITTATAPACTTLDNKAAALYDDSSETAAMIWDWDLPIYYKSDFTMYVLVSSDDASGTGTIVDWAVRVYVDDGDIAGTAYAQDAVECTSATLDASNELLTLTPDATLEAALLAGSARAFTFEIFNASTNDDDLEIKRVFFEYKRD